MLNYTTKVSSQKTVAEISSILGRKGAHRVSTIYGNNHVIIGIEFELGISGTNVRFSLPCKFEGVRVALEREGKRSISIDKEQCERIAWRICKDWIEAQIAMIEAGHAEMGEVFMPYAIDQNGRTFFQAFKIRQLVLTRDTEKR